MPIYLCSYWLFTTLKRNTATSLERSISISFAYILIFDMQLHVFSPLCGRQGFTFLNHDFGQTCLQEMHCYCSLSPSNINTIIIN